MKGIKTLLVVVAFVGLAGCSSQGRLTHNEFERQSANYQDLDKSLNTLYEEILDGDTVEQFKIVRALRHLAKYGDNPGKRDMAVRALVVLTAFTDDGDVKDRAESRAIYLMENGDRHTQAAVIKAYTDLANGTLGISYDDSSVFSSEVDMVFQPAGEDEREEAVEYLIDNFDDLDPFGQQLAIQAFASILAKEPNCSKMGFAQITRTTDKEIKNPLYRKPKEGQEPTAPEMIMTKVTETFDDTTKPLCLKDDGELMRPWKTDIIEEIEDFLAYEELPAHQQAALLSAVVNTKGVEKEFIAEQLQNWADSAGFPEPLLALTNGALSAVKGFHPALFKGGASTAGSSPTGSTIDENLSASEIAAQLAAEGAKNASMNSSEGRQFVSNTKLNNLSNNPSGSFWINNVNAILDRQLFLRRSTFANDPMTDNLASKKIPHSWIFYNLNDGSPEMNTLLALIYKASIDRLNSGFTYDSPRKLIPALTSKLDVVISGGVDWELDLTLDLTAAAGRSLKAANVSITPLIDLLDAKAQEADDLYFKQKIALTMVALLQHYPAVEEQACIHLMELGPYAQREAAETVKGYAAYKNSEELENSLADSVKFCGTELYPSEDATKKLELPEEEIPAEEETAPVEPQQVEPGTPEGEPVETQTQTEG